MRRLRRPVDRSTPESTLHSARPLENNLEANVKYFESRFSTICEFRLRRLKTSAGRDMAILFLEGIIDALQLEDHAIEPLISAAVSGNQFPSTYLSRVRVANDTEQVESMLLQGHAAVLIDKWSSAMMLGLSEKPARSIDAPERERVIQGPKESFTESLELNLALVRSRFVALDLKTEMCEVGTLSKTRVVLLYLESTADKSLLKKARDVIAQYKAPHLNHISDFEEIIDGHPWSPFPQSLLTERPDALIGALVEGRIAYLADGSASALVAPVTFPQLFQSPEDYYLRPVLASAARWLRMLAFVLTTTAVPVYVASVSYHYDIIPVRLLVQVAEKRSDLVFSPVTEALLLDVGVELLREAGIRLPKPLGQTLSVAAALVIGQSALAANIVSPLLVVTVGVTSLASFVIPNYSTFLALRLLRFFITIMAGFV